MAKEKITAKFRIPTPTMPLINQKLLNQDPIKFKSEIGAITIHMPGNENDKPKSYAEPEEKGLTISTSIRTDGAEALEANTLWLDIDTDKYLVKTNGTISEDETIHQLEKEVSQIVFRFLRLVRQQLIGTPIPLPTRLHYDAAIHFPSGRWYFIHSDPTITQIFLSKESFERAVITEDKWVDLQVQMESGKDTEIWQEFLTNGLVELEEEHMEQAIILTAIGCEVFIKTYTRKAANSKGLSESFWQYLEQRRPRVRDYYDPILHLVKGHSLRLKNVGMYNQLDRIFTQRNNILHHGILEVSQKELAQLKKDIEGVRGIINWVLEL